MFLPVTARLFVMVLLASSYRGGKWMHKNLADYLHGFFQLFISVIGRPMIFSNEVRKERGKTSSQSTTKNIWPILRGILLALPVVALFASLLASADLVFNQRLHDFLTLFEIENLPEYIFRLAYIGFVGYALA